MLKKNYEFKNVLNRGKYYSGRYIAIFIRKNNKNINFLGIAISSKLGKAVKRNYVKRIIRENYKQIEEHIKTGYDIVFIWKKQFFAQAVGGDFIAFIKPPGHRYHKGA